MLHGISPLIGPDLLKALAEMGHGDEITLADAHYPLLGSADTVIRMDGVTILPLLDAILRIFPLDHYQDKQYLLMSTVGNDPEPQLWKNYADCIASHDPQAAPGYLGRFEFYKRGRSSHVTVLTGDTGQYGNIVLPKGIVSG